MRASTERGGIMVVVLILTMALGAGAAIGLYVQGATTRGAGTVLQGREALFCAEAGLVAARDVVADNVGDWNIILDGDPENDPAWYPLTGDRGDGGDADWIVTLRDNDDEQPPATSDRTIDSDLRVFVVSRCTRNSETPGEVLELVSYRSGGGAYRNQSGQGAAHTGNAN